MTKAAELAKMGEVLTNSQIGGRRNILINGGMNVAQRGTSITVSSTRIFTLDRFSAEKDTQNMVVTQSSDAPTGLEYSLKATNGTGASSSGTDVNYVKYAIEGYDSNHLEIGNANAKKVTLSFYVKSSITGTYCVAFLDSGNDNPYVTTYTISSANTWEKKTITLTMSDYGSWVGSTTNGANLQIAWDLGSGSDRQVSNLNVWNDGVANDWSHSSQTQWVETTSATWQITGVQLEVGSQATPFEHRSYGEELALCQRYFHKSENTDSDYKRYSVMHVESTVNTRSKYPLPIPMRDHPALTKTGTLAIYNSAGGIINLTAISLNPVFTQNAGLGFRDVCIFAVVGSGLTAGTLGTLLSNNAAASLQFDAEL